ncbi:hypothetical protein OGATHE_001086 [Ogataea polymorpha]|uniref:Uncharacterized protein n=1 Tax=Ogataea polymorpha TaxID=460523 RepID=A0A9P8PR69_9ASCO|nr:hypothetical protein OGATHE_001086 [Ogataea polymorpha]
MRLGSIIFSKSSSFSTDIKSPSSSMYPRSNLYSERLRFTLWYILCVRVWKRSATLPIESGSILILYILLLKPRPKSSLIFSLYLASRGFDFKVSGASISALGSNTVADEALLKACGGGNVRSNEDCSDKLRLMGPMYGTL